MKKIEAVEVSEVADTEGNEDADVKAERQKVMNLMSGRETPPVVMVHVSVSYAT